MAKENKQQSIQEAKNLLSFCHGAVLSSIFHKDPAFPYGSIIPYDVHPDGTIVITVSQLAEHFKNLAAHSQASIFICDPFGMEDPQRHSRLTALGSFYKLEEESKDKFISRYNDRFPNSPQRTLVHDFIFFAMKPERLRWIGGFGDMCWIDGKEFAAAAFDPIAYLGAGIVEHMNADHQDAIAELVCKAHPAAERKTLFEMVAVDADGFIAQNMTTKIRQRIEFPKTASSPNEVREILIEMLKAARAG